MRKKHVIGNWKMNTTVDEGIELAQGIVAGLPVGCATEVVVVPPFTSLCEVGKIIGSSEIKLGAQNASTYESGAHTGEISIGMLTALGVSHVILGHSERRTLYAETNEQINSKVDAALEGGIVAVLCIGETLEKREAGKLKSVIDNQLTSGLAGIEESRFEKIIIAYEPVWAIGTGKSATSAQANEVHTMIRARVAELYSAGAAEKAIILYGGSVKPENAGELIEQENIDGFLVGHACLKSDSFLKIIAS